MNTRVLTVTVCVCRQQLNELTKSVASLEMKVSNLTDQRDRLQAELDSSELFHNRSQRDNSSVLQSSYSKVSNGWIELLYSRTKVI